MEKKNNFVLANGDSLKTVVLIFEMMFSYWCMTWTHDVNLFCEKYPELLSISQETVIGNEKLISWVRSCNVFAHTYIFWWWRY